MAPTYRKIIDLPFPWTQSPIHSPRLGCYTESPELYTYFPVGTTKISSFYRLADGKNSAVVRGDTQLLSFEQKLLHLPSVYSLTHQVTHSLTHSSHNDLRNLAKVENLANI